LFGEIHPKGQPGTPPPPQPAKTKDQVPPPTASSGASSNAELASMSGLSGGRPLAIPENQASAGTWNATTASATPVNLKKPEPIVVPLPREPSTPGPAVVPNNVVAAGSWGPQGQPTTPAIDALQAQLRDHGVLWQKRDDVPEGVKFSAIV